MLHIRKTILAWITLALAPFLFIACAAPSSGTAEYAQPASNYGSAAAESPAAEEAAAGSFSTGGTAIVNDEAYDATFFDHYGVNPFVDTEDDHFSTFAMDVDTAS